MIALNSLSKSYGQVEALKRTDLVFQPGETTVLIGPSGCGKSTILRLNAGLVAPDAGTVTFDGTTVEASSVLALRARMGYVIQDGGLFPHLTARENVALMARHTGMLDPAVEQRLDELCTLARFPKDGLDRYPQELSGGQRQRVSLMRALMLKPSVLLLDEPLGALDPMVRADLQADLKEIFSMGQTVVMVTHDMGEAAFLGDRIVLLSEGAIVQDGNLADFLERPASGFVTDFLNAQRSVVAL